MWVLCFVLVLFQTGSATFDRADPCSRQPIETATFTYCKSFPDPVEHPGVIYAVYWNLNETHIHFLQISNAQGWMGIGVSDDGSMNGHGGEKNGTFGDHYLGYFWEDLPRVADCHSDDDYPERDDKEDAVLISGSRQDGFFHLEWARLLNTNDDKEDYRLGPNNETYLLWSYSNSSVTGNGKIFGFRTKHEYSDHIKLFFNADEYTMRGGIFSTPTNIVIAIIGFCGLLFVIFLSFFKLCRNSENPQALESYGNIVQKHLSDDSGEELKNEINDVADISHSSDDSSS